MRWFGWRKSHEQELDDEIQAHLAMEAKQRVERGESPQDAEFAARRAFGNAGMVKEVTRQMWGFGSVESFAQDFRYAVRVLGKAPGFTVVAMVTLALGIGANTAIFSVVDAAVLRPLPFPDSDRLVRILATKNGATIGAASPMDLRDFAASAQSFAGMVGYDKWRKNVSGIAGSKDAEEMVVGLVPGAYFELLGVRPVLGRLFTEQESVPGKHYVAAISSSFWRTRFASDPAILEKTVRINGETYSILAVMPDVIPGWMEKTNSPIRIWTPFAAAGAFTDAARGDHGNTALARLKPGATYQQAQAELTTIAARLAREHPIDKGIGATIEPLADSRAGPVRPVLLMLCAAVGMVLVIACANLAGLLVARNSTRSREMAVRAALGAGRWRLVRQLLFETLTLSLAGGVIGLGFAWAAGIALARMGANTTLPYTAASNVLAQFWPSAPEPRVLLFTLGISVFTAILFGLAPAVTGTRVALAGALREGGRSGTAGAGKQRFRRLLVVTEVALSLVLVFAASLLTQTMARLEARDPGFRTDHLLLGHIYIPPARYPDAGAIARFCESLGERVRSAPGVVDATITTGYPPAFGWKQMFTIPGSPVMQASDVPTAEFAGVDTEYLRTFGFAVVSGRDFADTDTASTMPVAIVNQEFVRRYFGGRDAAGREIHPGPPTGIPAGPFADFGQTTRNITIIGVVRNFMNQGVAQPPAPHIFTLFRQFPGLNYGFKDIVVRTAASPESVATAVTRELKSLDADIPLGEVRSMETHMSSQTTDTRFTTVLLGLFAGLGTMLAVIGTYGVVAYLVAQRTQELGVRMALGAGSGDVLWLVLRYGMMIGLAGVGAGFAGSMLARQFLARFVYGAGGSDVWTLGGTAVALLVVVMVASGVPAAQAIRIDPVRALRGE